MDYLSVDFETRSAVDLKAMGVYRYAEDDSTDVWCMAWAINDDDPQLWRPGEPVPSEILQWVELDKPMRAWNAQFERTIWNRVLAPRYSFPPSTRDQWFCTAAEARAMALPGALGDAAIVLGVEQQKDMAGSRLMLQMARPRRILPDGRIEWWATPDKMQKLFAYCLQDVRTERAVFQQIRPLAERERKVFLLDQAINDRGVLVDLQLAKAAQDVADAATQLVNRRIREVTGGKAKSVTDIRGMLAFLQSRKIDAESLDKASVASLKKTDLPADVAELLTLREEAGKTSVKKIASMLTAACSDGRIRGTLLFHGAATGRWAGRLVQPQNFPRGSIEDIETYIPSVLARDVNSIDLDHPPLEVISSMLRSMFIADADSELVAADFSAIEARVTAWLANESWRLHVFHTHGKIYEASASMMFGVPMDQIVKGRPEYELRQKGKVAELALGFQGGVGALRAMGGESMGLSPEEMKDIVSRWRAASPAIVNMWKALEAAALDAVREPGTVTQACRGRIRFKKAGAYLWMQLPSGRRLAYFKPTVVEKETPWGAMQDAVRAWGMNSVTRKWEQFDLYGGILTENAVQAVAADILFEACLRCEEADMPVVLTVHDEVVCEVPKERASIDELVRVMTICPTWATGLPLAASGWQGQRYRKD